MQSLISDQLTWQVTMQFPVPFIWGVFTEVNCMMMNLAVQESASRPDMLTTGQDLQGSSSLTCSTARAP